MTAAMFNNLNGSFANVVDGYVYPQFIGYALRAPTTQDLYPAGTRWQDNSVSPPVIYQTTGAGVWFTDSGSAGSFATLTVTPGPTNITGTTNINTSGGAVTTIGGGGAGTITASAGLRATAGGITATLGNITATNGNIVRGTAGNKDIYSSVATTTAAGANSAGTVTLVGGTATVSTTSVTASSIIRIYRQGIGATGAAALGILTIGTVTAGTSFVIRSVQPTDATTLQASDVSVIAWELVN